MWDARYGAVRQSAHIGLENERGYDGSLAGTRLVETDAAAQSDFMPRARNTNLDSVALIPARKRSQHPVIATVRCKFRGSETLQLGCLVD